VRCWPKLHTRVNNELLERYRAKQDEVVEERHSEAAQVMIAATARAAEHEVLAKGLSRQLRECGSAKAAALGQSSTALPGPAHAPRTGWDRQLMPSVRLAHEGPRGIQTEGGRAHAYSVIPSSCKASEGCLCTLLRLPLAPRS
jgi:C4-dicarboxylate-specific signal transduction histidine kinase